MFSSVNFKHKIAIFEGSHLKLKLNNEVDRQNQGSFKMPGAVREPTKGQLSDQRRYYFQLAQVALGEISHCSRSAFLHVEVRILALLC